MGKLLVHQFVSLDGYAADAGGDFSLFGGGDVTTPEFDLELLVRLQLVDAILLGATTYRMFADYWPTPASGNQLIAPAINSIEKIVFSHTLDEAPWGGFAPARVESGDAVDVIRTLKNEKFGDLLVWGSLSLTDALFAAGLVDSVRIAVLPVILGSGRSPFPNGFAEREIRLVESHTFDVGIVASEYAVGHHAPVVTGAIEAPVAAPATGDESNTSEADGAPSVDSAAAGDEPAGSAAGAYAVGADGQGSYVEDVADAAATDADTETGAATDATAGSTALADAPPAYDEPSPYPESWNVEHAGSPLPDSERPGADLTGADPAEPTSADNAGADHADADHADTDHAADSTAADHTDQARTDQTDAAQATVDQSSAEASAEESTDQAAPAYPSPDEFAAGGAASLQDTPEQSTDSITDSVSDPWQPPVAQPAAETARLDNDQLGETAGQLGETTDQRDADQRDADQRDIDQPDADQPKGEAPSDGAGTPENFGTPEATDEAGDDKASATNPAPDPAESEWLVSRRKWE